MGVSSLSGDVSLQTAKLALDGLSLKQQAISRNLANIDTPGYKAQTVDFKQAISHAMNSGGGISLATTNSAHLTGAKSGSAIMNVARQGGTDRADQNNVDIDTELTDLSQTGITYQAISQEVSKKLLLLKAIATGS
jgi:flagellar basal-body rod protein FlgB